MWTVTFTQPEKRGYTDVLAMFKFIDEARQYIDDRVMGKHVTYDFDNSEKRIECKLLDGTYYTLIG